MELTRRGFLARAGATAAGGAVLGLGPTWAWADEEAPEDAAEAAPSEEVAAPTGPVAVCEECPGGCTMVLKVDDGRLADVEGDATNPLSEGRLCLRAQVLTEVREGAAGSSDEAADKPVRLQTPRVRRAGSDRWEDISWDRALDEIANLVKDTRDATFEERIDAAEASDEAEGERANSFDDWDWSDAGQERRPSGVPVMRTRAIGSFGGGRLLVEEQYLLMKALRSWGVVNLDSEAALRQRSASPSPTGCGPTSPTLVRCSRWAPTSPKASLSPCAGWSAPEMPVPYGSWSIRCAPLPPRWPTSTCPCALAPT